MFSAGKMKIYKEEKKPKDKQKRNKILVLWRWRGVHGGQGLEALAPGTLSCKEGAQGNITLHHHGPDWGLCL